MQKLTITDPLVNKVALKLSGDPDAATFNARPAQQTASLVGLAGELIALIREHDANA